MLPPVLLTILLLAIFLTGLGLGYVYTADSKQTQPEKLRTLIALVVTLVWVAAIAADMFLSGYMISPLIHAIMGAVVGYFFADKGLDINIGG